MAALPVQVNDLLHGADFAVVTRGEPSAGLLESFSADFLDNLLDFLAPSVCLKVRLDSSQPGKPILEHFDALDIAAAHVSKRHQFRVCRGDRNDAEP